MTTAISNILFPDTTLSAQAHMKIENLNEQSVSRPSIDEVLCNTLDGETLKEALFIIDNIRENNMKIKWSSVNVWTVRYKRKHVCDLKIDRGALTIGQISEVLATRVKNMPYNPENNNPLLDALKDLVSGNDVQEAFAAQ